MFKKLFGTGCSSAATGSAEEQRGSARQSTSSACASASISTSTTPATSDSRRSWASASDDRSDNTAVASNSPPGLSLNHLSPSASPSPTPQPATPIWPASGLDDNSAPAASKPIEITASTRASASASLSARNSSDHIDLAPFGRALDILNPDRPTDISHFIDTLDTELEMTTGPILDSAMGRSRQDSFVSAGPKPISMNNANRDQSYRGRRESLAGSLMGGMSWGGISMSNFVKDEMGTSPSPYFMNQSPSYHSSSYQPKLELRFLTNFTCCGRQFNDMHKLLEHYESSHHDDQPNYQNLLLNSSETFAPNQSNGRGLGGQAIPTTPAVGQAGRAQQASQPFQSTQQPQFQAGADGAGMGVSGMQQMMRRQQQQNAQQATHNLNQVSQMNDEMDAVGEMELDEPVGPMDMDESQRTMQQTRQLFGQQQRPQLHLNSAGLQGLRTSQPTTPAAVGFGFHNNPTVSSVNTPTLTTQQGLPQKAQAFAQDGAGGDMDFSMSGVSTNLAMGNQNQNLNGGSQFGMAFGNLSAMPTIDDPAKRLFTPGGTNQVPTPQQRLHDQQMQLQQQLQTMALDPTALSGEQQQALLMMLSGTGTQLEEHKPFKCPVIGCEKAYKNQNGLKYHKTHGHSTQQLHENGDGTFSIVNPETSAPYPGTTGMEKEKPFKCEACGKRYKNLNGLKYHKQHSPMCDPEVRAQHQTALATILQGQMGQNGMLMNLAMSNGTGLSNIGEDMDDSML